MTLDRNNFRRITLFIICLLFISLTLVKCFYWIFSFFNYNLFWWFETPSVLGTMVLLYLLFDNYLWKWNFFRKIRFIDIPDLNGRWKGVIKSSFQNHETELPAVIEIQQTSSKIFIAMYLQESSSKSLVAGFVKGDDNQPEIHYEYENIPKADAKHSMRIHFGTAQLRYCADKAYFLDGHYYSSARDRATYGTMKFQREGFKLLGRL